ncbi:hypothetical protein KL943_004600 [Ogataea angusta]|nr:hypothetical protein KL943_004600 [Ogataea angusta]
MIATIFDELQKRKKLFCNSYSGYCGLTAASMLIYAHNFPSYDPSFHDADLYYQYCLDFLKFYKAHWELGSYYYDFLRHTRRMLEAAASNRIEIASISAFENMKDELIEVANVAAPLPKTDRLNIESLLRSPKVPHSPAEDVDWLSANMAWDFGWSNLGVTFTDYTSGGLHGGLVVVLDELGVGLHERRPDVEPERDHVGQRDHRQGRRERRDGGHVRNPCRHDVDDHPDDGRGRVPQQLTLPGAHNEIVEDPRQVVLVDDLCVHVTVEHGLEHAHDEGDHREALEGRHVGEAEDGRRVGELALFCVHVVAVDEVDAHDGGLGGDHGLPEIPRSFHL